jgi:hypothetical protein
MYRQIAEQHPIVAASMTHVDLEASPRLERIESETRTEVRASQAGAARNFAREPESEGAAEEDEDSSSDSGRLFPAVS